MTTLFGLTSADLQIFLEKVKSRARIYNWTSVFLIPDDDGIPRDLLKQYGLLSLENCANAARAYVTPPTCLEQNSIIAFVFLQESLTDDARNMIMTSPDDYTINDQPSAACLLKIIIGKSTVDTYSTISVLRDYVSTLDVKMIELNSTASQCTYGSRTRDSRNDDERIQRIRKNSRRRFCEVYSE